MYMMLDTNVALYSGLNLMRGHNGINCKTNAKNKLPLDCQEEHVLLRENCNLTHSEVAFLVTREDASKPVELTNKEMRMVIYDSAWEERTVYMDGLYYNDTIKLHNR